MKFVKLYMCVFKMFLALFNWAVYIIVSNLIRNHNYTSSITLLMVGAGISGLLVHGAISSFLREKP